MEKKIKINKCANSHIKKRKGLYSLATWKSITSKNSVILCNSDGELENSVAQQLIANEIIYVYNLFVCFTGLMQLNSLLVHYIWNLLHWLKCSIWSC